MPRRQPSSQRRSSAYRTPSPTSSTTHNGFLTLSILCLFGMCFFFGGTRYWAAGPFLIPLFLSTAGLMFLTYLRVESRGHRMFLPQDYFFWILLILYVAFRAIFFTPIPFETWTECFWLITAWLVYGSFCELGNQKHTWTIAVCLLFLAAVIQAGLAIILHVNDSRMVLWIVRPLQYEMRASGTYICPNHYAHFLQMAMIVAFGVLLTPRGQIWLKLFAGYTFILCAIPLTLSLSRSGIIGVFVGISVLLLGKAMRKGWKRVAGALLLLATLGSSFVFALWKFYEPVKERLGRDLTHNIRISQIWPDTWAMIQEGSFWGAGPGTFLHTFDPYREAFLHSSLYLEYAHNEFLNTLAEYGWLVSILWLLGIGWLLLHWVRKGITTPSDQAAMIPITLVALVLGTLAHAVFDFNLHIPSNGLLFMALVGILYGQGFYKDVWQLKPRSVITSRIFCGTSCLLCLALLVFASRLMIGSFFEHRMNQADEAEDFDLKYEYAAKMRTWTPWYARGWTILGLEHRKKAFWLREPELKKNEIDLSREAYNQALQRNQVDKIAIAGLVELARIEAKPEEALRLIVQLRGLAPFDVRVRVQHGLILRQLGRNQEALEVFLEAKRINYTSSKQIDLNIKRLRQLTSKPSS